MKRRLPILVVLLAALFAWLQSGHQSSDHSASGQPGAVPQVRAQQADHTDTFPYTDPDRIREINNALQRIRTGERRFKQDGVIFRNAEGLLPEKPGDYYHEYTVVTPGAENRGARRIVQGKEGETYYSDDHYGSFIKINSAGVP